MGKNYLAELFRCTTGTAMGDGDAKFISAP
jgi:hypothetical protein